MEKEKELKLIEEMLKEQLYCLGRIFARHEVPDDVIWEVVKGFDLIYQRVKKQSEISLKGKESNSHISKMEPHPGLTYLLEKLRK